MALIGVSESPPYWWLRWVALTGLGFAFGAVIGEPLGKLNWPALGLMPGTFAAAALGVSVGSLQWVVLRRRITEAGWWIAATTAGFAIAGIITSEEFDLGVLAYPVFGAAVGTLQYCVLRAHIAPAILWIPTSTIAWFALPFLLSTFAKVTPAASYPFLSRTVAWLAFGVVLAATTGLALTYLWKAPVHERRTAGQSKHVIMAALIAASLTAVSAVPISRYVVFNLTPAGRRVTTLTGEGKALGEEVRSRLAIEDPNRFALVDELSAFTDQVAVERKGLAPLFLATDIAMLSLLWLTAFAVVRRRSTA